jgi:MoaA/NifB/PqqE/SkfB family radical SAM enzyme
VSVQQFLRDDPEVVDFINARERKITEYNTTNEVGQRLYFDCKAGKYSLCISNYGVLMPCQAANGLEPFMFDIKKLGIEQALNGLIKLIEKYKGKPLKYCNGCKKHKACSECLISQLKQRDLYSYMQQHCYEMNPNKL